VQLTAGDALGPYVVLSPAGSGGMGEVYKARDTRLDRIVALKVIAVGQSAVPDSRSRFADEARAIAALNHPHICALYDTGHALDRDFLVLEYLEGETLAQRLRRGPLPAREVLGIAIEIAEALDYAHRHDIIHRDLKPANVLLTRDSGAKLLDFGLADLRATARAADDLSTRATQPLADSPDSVISGTLQYLAPEVFDGRPTGPSSDVFAFGAVFYEMVTNRGAFDDASPARVMAAILSKEPPPIDAASGAPAEFQWIVQNCLAKDPADRWQSMGDVAKVLKGIARTSHAPAPIAAKRRHWIWIAAAAAAALVLVAAVVAFRRPPSSPAPSPEPVTLSLLPPAGSAFALTDSSIKSAQFAVAPDGRSIVFVAATAGVRALWLQEISHTEARLLPGTSGASYPFWSPDSQFVGFFADGLLKKVSLTGRSPLPICRANSGRGGAWSPDDRIVFTPDPASPLSIVSASGGDPTRLTELGADHLAHRWPQVLPDGHVLFFVRSTQPEQQGIYVTSLARPGELRRIRATAGAGMAVAGHLLFVLDGELVAQPLDRKAVTLSGDAVPLGLKVTTSSTMSSPVSASNSGVLATWNSGGGLSELVWFDRSGIRLGAAGQPERYIDFRLSPDQRRVALARLDPVSHSPDLGMLDLARNFVTAVASSSQTDASPIWSSSGERLVFRSNRRGLHELFEKPALDNGGERLLHSAAAGMYPTDWSPDGR
jgi:serine/threonine protein kinase